MVFGLENAAGDNSGHRRGGATFGVVGGWGGEENGEGESSRSWNESTQAR